MLRDDISGKASSPTWPEVKAELNLKDIMSWYLHTFRRSCGIQKDATITDRETNTVDKCVDTTYMWMFIYWTVCFVFEDNV